jgi:hypothetical protein
MDVETPVGSRPFTYQRVKLHLIFSFCLAHEKDPLYDKDVRRIARKMKGWSADLPKDRQGSISPFLCVNIPRAFKLVRLGKADVGGQAVEVSAMFRLFGVGGTATIIFDLEGPGPRSLTTASTHALFGATGLSYKAQASATPIQFSDKEYASAYALFHALLDEECKTLARELQEPLKWFDMDTDIIDQDAKIPQSPWSVTAYEVSGPEHDAFCSGTDSKRPMDTEEKAQRILPYIHDIGPILFRSVSGETFPIEPTYRGQEGGIDAGLGTSLSSMHLDARLFVCSSRRNVLCITDKFDNDAGRYFLPGVLGMSELVRARWHSLIVINRSLDRILDDYSETKDVGDFSSDSEGKPVESRRLAEQLQLTRIVTSRRWIARVLDDPGIYMIAGDALAALYARGKEIFALDELMTLLVRKADLIDRLHANEQQLSWMRRI